MINYQFKNSVKVLLSLALILLFTSCNYNPYFTKFPYLYSTNKEIPLLNQITELKLNKEDTLKISSLSTLNRSLFNTVNKKLIPKMVVDNRLDKKTFDRTIRFVDSLCKSFASKVIYRGTSKNDSIYKTLITPTFLSNYDHLQMQGISFLGKKDGIYLIITVLENEILSWGADPPAGNYTSYNTLYEFFDIKDGIIVRYKGYSLGRCDLRKKEARYSPRYKHLKWVIKQLYKN